MFIRTLGLVGGGASEIHDRFVKVVGASNARARFLVALGGIVVGVVILR